MCSVTDMDKRLRNVNRTMGEARLPEPERLYVHDRNGVPIAPWQPVRCPHCEKVATEALPGSTVKVECRRCKRISAVTIAA